MNLNLVQWKSTNFNSLNSLKNDFLISSEEIFSFTFHVIFQILKCVFIVPCILCIIIIVNAVTKETPST